MLVFYVLQILVPISLILWVAVAGARSLVGFWIQVGAAAVVFITLMLIGVWTALPRWTPLLLALPLILATTFRFSRLSEHARLWPANGLAWLAPGLFLVIAAYGLTQFGSALYGRMAPASTIDIGFPFRSGTFLVVNGGNSLAVNAHHMTLAEDVPNFRRWRGQSHALDLVQINAMGWRASGILPEDPASYFIYGTDVVAPCAGTVKQRVDGIPDNRVPQVNRDAMAGNFVILDCADVEVVLAHFIPGTIVVAEGDRVEQGTLLAQAGNSGNSGEPHLHIHVQARGAPANTFDTQPLPFTINQHYWARGQRMTVRL